MTDTEKQNVLDVLCRWGADCIQKDEFPVLLITIPAEKQVGTDIKTVQICKAAPYSNTDLRKLLHALADNIPI